MCANSTTGYSGKVITAVIMITRRKQMVHKSHCSDEVVRPTDRFKLVDKFTGQSPGNDSDLLKIELLFILET